MAGKSWPIPVLEAVCMSLDEVRRTKATEATTAPPPPGGPTPTVGAASARASGPSSASGPTPAGFSEDEDREDGLELSEDLEDEFPEAPEIPETPEVVSDLYMDLDDDGLVSDEERALFLEDEEEGAVPDDEVEPATPAAEAPRSATRPSQAGRPASPKGPTVRNSHAPAGFLWKPVSDSDGNLAILLPPGMTGKVAAVRVLSPDGQVLEEGRTGGVGNGGREHFRFKHPGGSFPPNCQVQILMKDGSQQTIPIPNPGVRNEGG